MWRADMEKKRVSLVAVVLYGVAAVIWIIRTILDIAYGTFEASMVLFVLNILCTGTWVAAFFVTLHRYRSNDGKK